MRVGLYTSLRIPGACTKIVRCLHIALVMERDWVREFVISGRTTRILNTVTIFLSEKRVEHDKEEPTAKEICDFKRKIDNWRRVFNRNNKPKIPAPINVQPLVKSVKSKAREEAFKCGIWVREGGQGPERGSTGAGWKQWWAFFLKWILDCCVY